MSDVIMVCSFPRDPATPTGDYVFEVSGVEYDFRTADGSYSSVAGTVYAIDLKTLALRKVTERSVYTFVVAYCRVASEAVSKIYKEAHGI
jgi:hypothetical protein